MTLCEILKNEYLDFQEFCSRAEKVSPSDLSNADFIAFRTQYGVDRCYIAAIREKISNATNESLCSKEQTEPLTKPEVADIVAQSHDPDNKITLGAISSTINVAEHLENDSINDSLCETYGEIPYDIYKPLYVVLGIDNPKQCFMILANAHKG